MKGKDKEWIKEREKGYREKEREGRGEEGRTGEIHQLYPTSNHPTILPFDEWQYNHA